MAHKHSSGHPIRRSMGQKSSEKTPDFLYSELPGQWQNFNHPDEDLPQATKQHVVEPDEGSPSAQQVPSASGEPTRPSSGRNLELEICLTEARNQKLALELKVLRLRHTDGSADVTTKNSGTLCAPKKTCKKRTVDWPHKFAPGNFSSIDYVKLGLPDFVGGFLTMIKSYDAPLKSAMLDLLELLMAKASRHLWSSVRSFHSHIARKIAIIND